MEMKCRKAAAVFVWAVLLSAGYGIGAHAEGGHSSTEDRFGSLTLNINEVSRLALDNNFDIQLTKYDARIARTRQDISESVYDTVLSAEIYYRNNKSQRTSTLAGTVDKTNDSNFGLSKTLPSGTTVSGDLTHNRTWSDSLFASLNPSHDVTFKAGVKQDLGRNFFGRYDRTSVQLTRLEIEQAEFTSLEKIEEYLSRVQKAYWDLVLQTARVRIEEDMVRQSRDLYDFHQSMIQHGFVEKTDLLGAQANYEDSRNQLKLAENGRRTAENTLRILLNIMDDDVRIVPSDAFDVVQDFQTETPALQTAFENRPDYKSARVKIEASEMEIVLKKDRTWPEIDLTLSLAKNGVAGAYDKAYEGLAEDDYTDFFTGLAFSMPLENRKAGAELKAADLKKVRALVALKGLEREIAVKIMDRVRSSRVFQELALSAVSVSAIQSEKLEAERKRFAEGRSDTDTLIRFQQDVSRARLAAEEAKYRFVASVIDLRREEGTLSLPYWEGNM